MRKSTASVFSPYVEGQGPGTQIGEAQIRERLAFIQPYTSLDPLLFLHRRQRTDSGNRRKKHGLKTMVGVWLDD